MRNSFRHMHKPVGDVVNKGGYSALADHPAPPSELAVWLRELQPQLRGLSVQIHERGNDAYIYKEGYPLALCYIDRKHYYSDMDDKWRVWHSSIRKGRNLDRYWQATQNQKTFNKLVKRYAVVPSDTDLLGERWRHDGWLQEALEVMFKRGSEVKDKINRVKRRMGFDSMGHGSLQGEILDELVCLYNDAHVFTDGVTEQLQEYIELEQQRAIIDAEDTDRQVAALVLERKNGIPHRVLYMQCDGSDLKTSEYKYVEQLEEHIKSKMVMLNMAEPNRYLEGVGIQPVPDIMFMHNNVSV